jgi:aspartate aminotransferase
MLAKDLTLNKEYLPVLGLPAFTTAATSMLLGQESKALIEGRATGIQTLSGTGALRVVAEFLSKTLGYSIVYSSDPTWGKGTLTRTYNTNAFELRGTS